MSLRSRASVVGLGAALAAAFALSAAGLAHGQNRYPTKPVRIVVGFTPGSATDTTARMIGPKLSEIWGQPVVIENRSGAGGVLASAMVAQATPDGHTLLMMSTAFAITAVLQKNLPYDPLRDFRGVAQVGSTTSALTVTPSLGLKSVADLVALTREKPGTILFGTTGVGSGVHMTTERFNMAAGVNAVHVPYKGQPEMLVDIVTGRIHYGFPGLAAALPFIRDGRLQPLAIASQKRSPVLPNVPAMTEVVSGFERDSSHGLLAPARTPRAILLQVASDVARVLELPDMKQRMDAIGFEAAPTTPDEYDRILRSHIELFTQVAKAAGLLK